MADELQAITLEEDEPLDHIGEEDDPPEEVGEPVAEEDAEPPTAGEEEVREEEETGEEAPGSWFPAACLLKLRSEIDARWPNRDRRTDGMIGDLAHCPPGGGSSDHCPNSARAVRAYDIDSDGIPAAWLAEHLRQLGAAGDGRLANGGYVIFNRRIASSSRGWTWRTYNGSSPHMDHIHLSVSRDASGYGQSGGWNVRSATGTGNGGGPARDLPKHKPGSRTLRLADPRMRGTDVAFVQRWLGIDDDGAFGNDTKARVVWFQGRQNLEPTGVVDASTWKKMRAG